MKIKSGLLLICTVLSALLVLTACGHEHTYAQTWQSDDTRHWQEVTCKHTDAVQYENHVPGGGYLVGDDYYYTCAVCARAYKDDTQTARMQQGTEAVLELVNAYLNKQGLLEYDQFNSRRQMYATPEEATAQSYVFLDCSSYVASVYYNTFGVRVIPESYGSQNTKNYTKYAKENVGKSSVVIGYYETMDYATAEEQDALLEEIKAMLRPGDIIVYRRGSKSYGASYKEDNLSGHAILYMGDGKFTHSTGTSYNDGTAANKQQYRENPEEGADRATRDEYNTGTVSWLAGNQVLARGSGSRMLFGEKSSTHVYNFSILRPMMQESGVPELSEQAKCRMAIPGVGLEKTVDVGLNSAVCKGETITYTVKVWNRKDCMYENVSFKETLPEGVTLVESSIPMEQNGNVLTASFGLIRYEIKYITWTVRVNADTAAGTQLCSRTLVGGLALKEIQNTVAGYSRETLSAIATRARECAENGMTFSDPFAFVSYVYTEVLGSDPFGGVSAQGAIDAIFATESATKATLKTDGALSSMVAPNLYGGASLAAAYSANRALMRTVYEASLTEGDVIVCEWNGNTRVYIYLGEGTLAAIDSIGLTCELKDNGSEEWVKDGSNYYQRHLLASLFAYRTYAVLRAPGLS